MTELGIWMPQGWEAIFNFGEPCCDNFYKQVSYTIKQISNYTVATYASHVIRGDEVQY